MDNSMQEGHGALVGWSAERVGSRMALKIQSVQTPAPHRKEDIQSFLYVMDRNQAVQLGNYLFEIAGQTPPRRKRSWFDRLLGA